MKGAVMTVRELARLVADMRAAQRQQFCLRSSTTLMRLEHHVDRAVRAVLKQPLIFDRAEDAD